jgi:3-oxoacyl-[acyl-carrier protein] reductase
VLGLLLTTKEAVKLIGPESGSIINISSGISTMLPPNTSIYTQGNDEGDFRKWVETQSPLGRIGQPDDISPTAVYLASSDSKYMTGETVRVTGGI